MEDAAGWIALVATCVAAIMTASNLGPRVTGWGFVVFAVGAVAWIIVGAISGQTQLLYSNIFLGIVDLFGIWRWLGHRVKISDTAQAEEERSARVPGENLFSLAKVDGMSVKTRSGEIVARAVDALAGCSNGRIDYLIVRVGGVGGVGEKLHRLPWSQVELRSNEVRTSCDAAAIEMLPLASA